MDARDLRTYLRTHLDYLYYNAGASQYECGYCSSGDYIFSGSSDAGMAADNLMQHIKSYHPTILNEWGPEDEGKGEPTDEEVAEAVASIRTLGPDEPTRNFNPEEG